MQERNQVGRLIRSTVFLDGAPVASRLNPIKIRQTVFEMVSIRQEGEPANVRAYNDPISFSCQTLTERPLALPTKTLEKVIEWRSKTCREPILLRLGRTGKHEARWI